jgi:sporulation protein YlmC with PRC-barrel domain
MWRDRSEGAGTHQEENMAGEESRRGRQGRTLGGARRRVLSATTLAGERVVDSEGEHLGKVDEIMVDLESGRIGYVVLSSGGVLGMGDKLFAVPWEAFEIDIDRKELILDMDKDRLKQAPGFDKGNWPDFADPDWGAQIHNYYGYDPYWEL